MIDAAVKIVDLDYANRLTDLDQKKEYEHKVRQNLDKYKRGVKIKLDEGIMEKKECSF